MTKTTMDLSALLAKHDQGDLLRSIAEAVLQLIMEADVDVLIGAGRHERAEQRTTWRNGYRDRSLDTRLGTLNLRVPKLRQTRAFMRIFVHWAVEHFDWPGKSAEEMFRYSKVINEYEVPPLEVLHSLLITLRLGRHFKGEFRLTKRGAELAQARARLFAELIPFFILKSDHASYARFEERPFGKWDVWMNVINVEADHGTTERALFAAFYGEEYDWENAGWREMAAFSSCVLRPLEWAGLLVQTREEREGKHIHHVFKTPLWRSALKLDTDRMLQPVSVQ